jgi:hypothetical protein
MDSLTFQRPRLRQRLSLDHSLYRRKFGDNPLLLFQ